MTRKHLGIKSIFKKFLCMLLVLALVPVSLPPLPAAAAVDETLVTSLAEVYGGDEERAQDALDLLCDAGIIDESGNMVYLDIREDGEYADLTELAQRIEDGEYVGDITVNGKEISEEQLVKISEVQNALELLRLLDEDIEITDEHVANLEALISGIADGSIDLSGVLKTGAAALSAQNGDGQSAPLLMAPMLRSPLLGTSPGLPDTTVTEGAVETDGNGNYTGHYINGDTYEESHSFALTDPENTGYYTDSRYSGVGADGVITLSCDDTTYADYIKNVTATLDKPQSVPVSFDYAVAGGGLGANSNAASGTVTWNPGESGPKTFRVWTAEKGENYWRGDLAVPIRVGNVKNAKIAGNADVWNYVMLVNANDGSQVEQDYAWLDFGTYAGSTFTSGTANYDMAKYYYKTFSGGFGGSEVRITFNTYVYSNNGGYSARLAYNLTNGPYTGYNYHGGGIEFWNPGNDRKYSSGNREDTVTKTGVTNEDTISVAFGSTSSGNAAPFRLNSAKVEVKAARTQTGIEGVTVPAGTYYSGQIVPITIETEHYVVPSSDTKLMVNGKACPLLDGAGIESKKLTFSYVVGDDETGAINVTGLNGEGNGNLKNYGNKNVTVTGSFPAQSFDADDGVYIVPSVKKASLNLNNIKYGVTDESGEQTVTVVIPFKNDANLDWTVNEGVAIGDTIQMPLPGYPDATVTHYLAGAYFSCDGGQTRYPAYLVNSGANEGVAIATRFTAPINATAWLRQDTLDFFMDQEIILEENVGKYLGAWDDAELDGKGFAYFEATNANESAPVYVGAGCSYYIKGGVMFEDGEVTSRNPSIDYTGRVSDGLLSLDDGNYVALQDAENPGNQYDVEIIMSSGFYNAYQRGVRAEDPGDYTLSYIWSDRKNFTFTAPKYFKWESSDPNVATMTMDENGVGHAIFKGNQGKVRFTLVVGNGSEAFEYRIECAKELTVQEGKTPFLTIPALSQRRTTLTNTNTDVLLASNVTARNAAVGAATTFNVKLFGAEQSGNNYVKARETPVWTGSFSSTISEPLTHVTIPGSQIGSAGAYIVEIATHYAGGEVEGKPTEPMNLSASAVLIAKQAPAQVTIERPDSLSCAHNAPPTIRYTVTPANAEVWYTIQKSGGEVSARTPASGGTIPFSPSQPSGLKDAYIITVYARNSDAEAWSTDSVMLTVYSSDMLDIIVSDVTPGEIGGSTGGSGTVADGTTVLMQNSDKLRGYGITGESTYQLDFSDFTTLRTDMSLQKVISANYGSGTWGRLSDKMMWESDNPDSVSVDYKQGGIYSDIRNYSYVTYAPATDFLLAGKKDTAAPVTIKATHAGTGISSQFTVETETLKDKLYVFQFNPKAVTNVTYTNGAGVKRTLQSNAGGELAVYEPAGIAGALMAVSTTNDGDTYVGTLFPEDLVTGEKDIASLQLYPCNNLRMRAVSNVTLTFQMPDGSPYSGPVTIRGGVYKNGIYCPEALIKTSKTGNGISGRTDINANVDGGKLNLWFDPSQFKHDPQDSTENSFQAGDTVTYVFEYRFGSSYVPGYVTLSAASNLDGEATKADSLIRMRNIRGTSTQPQIMKQRIRQYFDGNTPTPYTRDVIDYTENIGISKRFGKVELYSDVALLGQAVGQDANGYTTLGGVSVADFALYTTAGRKLTGQTGGNAAGDEALQVISLEELTEETELFVFPFSAVPIARSVYTMTDENMKKDGITDETSGSLSSSRVMMVFTRDGLRIKNETLPFGVSNLSHQVDPSTGDATAMAGDIKDKIEGEFDIGKVFTSVNVNDLIRQGFVFLGKLSGEGGEHMLHMMILPTENPGSFRIVAFVGANNREDDDDGDGVSVNYNPNDIYEDAQKFEKELKEMAKDDKKKKKDNDSNGEASLDFNFYGTIIIDATWDSSRGRWNMNFSGGNVGTNVAGKYEWGQNFLCGPVPINVSFEAGFNADLELAFASKDQARAMLLDALLGVSVEAFAGLGFDLSLVALKFGIFGEIGANVNFLYLTKGNMTGTKLDIAGEIGIRAEVKIVFVKYKKTLASTGFGWTKKWQNYDRIKETWENDGYADVFGMTTSGRQYTMRLFASGTALVLIDGEGEIENRDYLEIGERVWNGGEPTRVRLLRAAGPVGNALNNVQTNAYPYANPKFADDGGMFLYISDNDNQDELQSVVSYAVKSGNGYDNMGALDTDANNILADSDVVASGSDQNVFAAWVKQMESPEKEMKDKATYDDLGMMMNATEVYAGKYDGSSWTVNRLTDNYTADMAPTIASSGNRAIVAWRSLSASSLPADGSGEDITTSFNAENLINYRIYNGTDWEDAQIAYNGASGTVNALDAAMLADGSALIAYSVRTGADVTTSETFYTLIGPDGNVLTTGRLTNDDYTDTAAQAAAVGNDFIVGWYSEHDAGLAANSDGEKKVAHDICLARIGANGSVDMNFPESIGDAGASATSDFRFSVPAGADDLSKLSIVWSQRSESENDKYELNAVRFYEADGNIGVSAVTDIAKTASRFSIDNFDAYTDNQDTVHALILGSDYSNISGMDVYDTIDLSSQGLVTYDENAQPANHLAILEQNPEAAIKLGSGTFVDKAIEAEVDTDLYDLMPGFNQPVQFNVKNTGASVINRVEIALGTAQKTFNNLNLLPNRTVLLQLDYPVPQTVADVDYTVTADSSATAHGTLVLNRPDIAISGLKMLRESEKTRDIQVTLANVSGIPLAGSGKTVKLAFYKDSRFAAQVGTAVTVPSSSYADIDDGIYATVQTLNVDDFIEPLTDIEVPDGGVRVYAKAWVENADGSLVDELYPQNNTASLSFRGLLEKYESSSTMDTVLLGGENGAYTVSADIRNNSLQLGNFGDVTADIMDAENRVLKSVPMARSLTLTGEASRNLTATVSDIEGTPAAVSLRSSLNSVILDAETNGGSCVLHSISLTKDGTLPNDMPIAEKSGSTFNGWFTEPTGGEKILADTVIKDVVNLSGAAVSAENPMIIYAQFASRSKKTDDTVKVEVSGDDGAVSVNVSVKNGTAAVAAPTAAQMAEILDNNKKTGSVTIDVSGIGEKVTVVSIPSETIKAFDKAIGDDQKGLTVKMPDSTVTFDPVALSAIAAEAKGTDIALTVEHMAESKLTDSQKTAIAELDVQAVYDVYLQSGGKRISSFNGGNASVRVMHKVKEGQRPGAIIVWYVAENGEKTKVPTIATKTFVTWTASHFSNYVVAYDETQSGVCPQDETCPMALYDDLKLNGWYHDGIHFVLENGIMTGIGKTTFAPYDKTNRAMMAQILWNMEDGPAAGYDISYTDVPETSWYAKAVRWASGVGIMEGYGKGQFGPKDNLTREQLVTILYRYAKSKDAGFGNEKASLSGYADASSISSWASEAMSVMVAKGIITGRSETKLAPKESASRAEIATIVMRYFMEAEM